MSNLPVIKQLRKMLSNLEDLQSTNFYDANLKYFENVYEYTVTEEDLSKHKTLKDDLIDLQSTCNKSLKKIISTITELIESSNKSLDSLIVTSTCFDSQYDSNYTALTRLQYSMGSFVYDVTSSANAADNIVESQYIDESNEESISKEAVDALIDNLRLCSGEFSDIGELVTEKADKVSGIVVVLKRASMQSVYVRLTKGGKPVWLSKETRARFIVSEIIAQGYDLQLSVEEVMGNKYYIARSATTISNRIEKALKTQSQLNKYMADWRRYDHLHDSVKSVSRDYFERCAIEKELGSTVGIVL